MSLPTSNPDKFNNREAVKRDFSNLDSLLSEMAVPKEEINNARPGYNGPQAETDTPPPGGDPFGGGSMYGPDADDFGGEGLEGEGMPDDVAKFSGNLIAHTFDEAVGAGLGIYANTRQNDKYKATPEQMGNLENAWTAVAKKMHWKVEDNAVPNLLILLLAVYLPSFQEAKNDKRFAEMDNRMKEQQRQIEANERRLKHLEEKEPAA